MNVQISQLLRQSITAEQRKLDEAMQAVIARPCADENEMASYCESANTGIIIMHRAHRRLLHLKQRIAEIENSTRAMCMDCGETISSERLTAVPDAVRCALCQADWEKIQEPLRQQGSSDGYSPIYA